MTVSRLHSDCNITVTPGPLAISPAAITIQVGTAVTFTATGADTYLFSKYSGVGTIDAGGVYSSPVEGTAVVRVTDNYDRTQDAAVTVNPPPLVLSPASITIQAGSAVTFTATGGTPAYTYSMQSGVGSIDPVSGEYTSSVTGSATVKVTDSKLPVHRSTTATVTVDPPPAPPLNLSPISVNVQTGSDQTFTATGGTTPYTWEVVEGAGGGTITSGGVYTAPGAPGFYTVRVTDLDATVRNAAVQVYLPLVITTTPASINAGATFDFNASGGIQPYVFSITPVDFGSIASGTGLYTAPGTSGIVTVRVTDSQDKAAEWSCPILDPATWGGRQSVDTAAKPGQYASLALDASGNPRIAYYDAQNKDLKYAAWNGSSWGTPVIVDSTGDVGRYASLALDASGNPRIAYYVADNPKKDLRYAAWNGSAWVVTDVDTAGDVGQYASLALDSSDNPRIAYYDFTNKDLKYAKWNGTSWEAEIVDSDGDVGQYASLALDDSGNPRIAYYDATNKDLKYAKWNGVSWVPETVDSIGDVGQFASLKLDALDQPSIAFYDVTGKNLKLATYSGSWNIATIDSTGDVGKYASLALDQVDSHPLIAYYDQTNGNLRYAELHGTIWLTLTVDAPSDVGQYASLALDAAGLMRIAYYNFTSQDLLYIEEQ